MATTELSADVVIIGGGVGGCAAALAAARMGASVILTEETDWLGGQLTQQAVPPDEHVWIEDYGCTQSYRTFREIVRAYYHNHYPLTAEAHANPRFNPGNGLVSKLCHEPRVAVAALEAMLAPWRAGEQITVLLETEPVQAEVDGDRVRAVTVRRSDGTMLTLRGRYFLDATELGDLLPMTGAEYVTGFESQNDTNEPHAPGVAQPANHQSFAWCFAMEHRPGENHVGDRPEDYAFWRDYLPTLTPAWPGKLLAWPYSQPKTCLPFTWAFNPEDNQPGLWTYRRLLDRRNFTDDRVRDVCLVNWPHNDYWLGNLCDVSAAERAQHERGSRQLSLSLFHWLQTEAPRPDGGTGWSGLRLRPDVMGTADGLAKRPYIRESRRIRAEFTVTERHVGREARMAETHLPEGEVKAAPFADSVGIGRYGIDLHPSSGGNNYIDIAGLPFQIPLGALIPVRLENLLPACKNLGVTHMTNGCYRLHPVEWNIGEAAGALAAYCLAHGESPRGIRNSPDKCQEFQQALVNQGVELAWP